MKSIWSFYILQLYGNYEYDNLYAKVMCAVDSINNWNNWFHIWKGDFNSLIHFSSICNHLRSDIDRRDELLHVLQTLFPHKRHLFKKLLLQIAKQRLTK